MGERERLEDNIKRMTAELADMKASVAKLPKEERKLAIFKGDYVLAEGKCTGRDRLFLVISATPTIANLAGLTAGHTGVRTVKLAGNNTINADSCDTNYKYVKVLNKEQAMAMI